MNDADGGAPTRRNETLHGLRALFHAVRVMFFDLI